MKIPWGFPLLGTTSISACFDIAVSSGVSNLTLGLGSLSLLGAVRGFSTPNSRAWQHSIIRLPPSAGNTFALTYDDGPSPELSPQLLDVLDAHKAHATFFVLGTQARRYPGLLKEIVARGHSIGSHGQNHRWQDYLSPSKAYFDLSEAKKNIEDVSGRRLQYYRPPFGALTPPMLKACRRLTQKMVGWSLRSYDTLADPHRRRRGRIVQRLGGGDIVLLHDGRHHPRRPEPLSLDYTVALLERAKDIGLRSISLDEAFSKRSVSL